MTIGRAAIAVGLVAAIAGCPAFQTAPFGGSGEAKPSPGVLQPEASASVAPAATPAAAVPGATPSAARVEVSTRSIVLNRPREDTGATDATRGDIRNLDGAGFPTAAVVYATAIFADGTTDTEITWVPLNPELITVEATSNPTVVRVRPVYVTATSSTLLDWPSEVHGVTSVIAFSRKNPTLTATVDVIVNDLGKVALDVF